MRIFGLKKHFGPKKLEGHLMSHIDCLFADVKSEVTHTDCFSVDVTFNVTHTDCSKVCDLLIE